MPESSFNLFVEGFHVVLDANPKVSVLVLGAVPSVHVEDEVDDLHLGRLRPQTVAPVPKAATGGDDKRHGLL